MKLIIEKGQDNPILRKKSTPVKTSELHLYRVLTETMLAYIKNPKHGGIGLAAPQVGINKRIIVVGLQNKRDDDTYSIVVMINPEIKQKSPQTDIDEEGCLSLPGLLGKVERSTGIELEWIDIKGRKMKKTITGYGARVVQHEVDHLDGVMICDKFLK
ncbi:peptide deformylase [Candidatus Gracilibacteria bacterium]|nr:peptide deformylase [Candidatus Gracilibacteria bacterium]